MVESIGGGKTGGTSVRYFYHKYKDAILFNKNLLIADTCSLFASALLAEMYSKLVNSSYIADSIFTAVVEYSIDTPIFFLLYYVDNKRKYIIQDSNNVTRKKDTAKIKNDIKRLLGVFSLCDIMYIIIKIFIQYQLLQQANLQPYQAAMFSSLIGWAAFLILINITMKATRIFNKDELIWYYTLILSISISNSVIFFSNLDLKMLYDNAIIDVSAAIAVTSALIVVFRQQKLGYKINSNKTFISLAAGLILWFTAEIIWTYYQLWLGIKNPFPSIADTFWLIGYGFFIYSVYKILFNLIKINTTDSTRTTTADRRGHRHLVIIIFSVIAVIGITLSYIAGSIIFGGINPFSKQQNDEIIKFPISIAYPILDGILLVPTATILWSLRRADPAFTHWILICSFIVMSTIGDIGFAYRIDK
jgi:hypothetical protein